MPKVIFDLNPSLALTKLCGTWQSVFLFLSLWRQTQTVTFSNKASFTVIAWQMATNSVNQCILTCILTFDLRNGKLTNVLFVDRRRRYKPSCCLVSREIVVSVLFSDADKTCDDSVRFILWLMIGSLMASRKKRRGCGQAHNSHHVHVASWQQKIYPKGGMVV